MEKIKSELTINDTLKKITISGLKREVIIDYSSDVDFTDLVSVLSEHIDSCNEIEISNLDSTSFEPKLKIVIEATFEIFKKYNENMRTEVKIEPASNDDLPF